MELFVVLVLAAAAYFYFRKRRAGAGGHPSGATSEWVGNFVIYHAASRF